VDVKDGETSRYEPSLLQTRLSLLLESVFVLCRACTACVPLIHLHGLPKTEKGERI